LETAFLGDDEVAPDKAMTVLVADDVVAELCMALLVVPDDGGGDVVDGAAAGDEDFFKILSLPLWARLRRRPFIASAPIPELSLPLLIIPREDPPPADPGPELCLAHCSTAAARDGLMADPPAPPPSAACCPPRPLSIWVTSSLPDRWWYLRPWAEAGAEATLLAFPLMSSRGSEVSSVNRVSSDLATLAVSS
jgi:hypothetical protein